MKRFILACGTLATLTAGVLLPSVEPANAECKPWQVPLNPLFCATRPKPKPQAGVGCLVTSMKYIRVENRTNSTVNFSINGQAFQVAPGYGLPYEYRFEPEIDDCRPNPAPHPTIQFDGSFANGFQSRSYVLPGGPYDTDRIVYYFEVRGNDLDLRR